MNENNLYIDLFAGCGGLSLGLHNAGWHGLFAVERSPDAFSTLKHNLIDNKQHFSWPIEWLEQRPWDINHLLDQHKAELINLRTKVDLVTGGPPCQGFSTAGKRNENDIRNGLIKSYLKFIMYVRPKLIFFENVKGFTQKFEKNKTKGTAYSVYVTSMLNRIGYKVQGRLVDFSKFGIPQKRTRFILVGIRNDVAEELNVEPKIFFEKIKLNKKQFLADKKLPQSTNLGNAISDLLKGNGLIPTPDRKNFESGKYSPAKSKYQSFLRKGCKLKIPNSHSFPKHKPAIIERFTLFLESADSNKNISNETKAALSINKHVIIPLSKKYPAPTLTTLPDDYIHYSEPRILTVREYARIQSFPDWYEFQGKYTTGGKERVRQVPRYTQIGNAIPPLFGEQSGIVLKNIIND